MVSRASSAATALHRFRERTPERVLANGWRVRGTTHGGIVVLALPGALGTGALFYRLSGDALPSGHEFVSATYPAVADPIELADGAAAALRAITSSPAVIVGSSIGGYIAQLLAGRHPELVDKVVLGNTFRDPTEQHEPWPTADVFAATSPEAALESARARFADQQPSDVRGRELREAMLSELGMEQSAAEVRAIRLAMLRAAALAPVGLDPDRVLVLDCNDDPIITPWTREDVRSAYAASRQVAVENGGHYPFVLNPDDYIDALSAFLTE
jgi:pimeloyl-ACP methyl ester carboxylesterase